MDITPGAIAPSPRQKWRPENCDRIALVLQGGGALGAYQAGVYEALHEAGIEPDWIDGVSIGAINGALIAGNPPERRLERLREFWELVTSRHLPDIFPHADEPRRMRNLLQACMTLLLGQPGFFTPNVPNPWFSLRGAKTATAFYDSAPLLHTLRELVDFDLINNDTVRYAVGTVNVATGNFIYFDNAKQTILPQHIMASAALPPGLPMVRIGSDYYWDGGLVSNTPLSHLMDEAERGNMLVFQVDLFSARGEVPRDMSDVLARAKEIRYSSRTRLVTDQFRILHNSKMALRKILNKVPDEKLSRDERELKEKLKSLPRISLLRLIYRKAVYEDQALDYEFSTVSMKEHWERGYQDTKATLAQKDWLVIPSEEVGLVVHDVHQLAEMC